MSDGAMIGITYQKEHQIWGWHRHDTDGTFESVTTIPENNLDAVYVIVKRTINGKTRRYIERIKPRTWTTAADAFIVDSGLTYSGVSATVISKLDHLEGKTVAVLAGGNVVNGLKVTSGSITLPEAATKAQIGLPYVSDIETLDVDPLEVSVRGKPMNVAEVIVKVENSRGGFIGPNSGNLEEFPSRKVSDDYDPLDLETTEYRIPLPDEWTSNGHVFIRQVDPLPITVLGIVPDTDVG